MPPTIVLLAIAILAAVALGHGYRTLTALLVLRSLPSADADEPPPVTDGEQVALTGELVVEEPVERADAAVEDADRSVGAYLWRSRFSDNTNSDLTIEDSGWERQHWHTFASGVEWGRFGVAADGRTVYIDPAWLREATETDPLEGLEVGGITKTDRFAVYLWDSWYTYLRDRTDHRSLRRFAGHVRRHNDGVDLDRYLLEARPLLDGTTVSVSGELRTERGDPVLRGSDEAPLLLSDQGFDGHRRWLRRRALRKGAFVAGLLAVAGGLWVGFYVPLIALIVAWLVYLGYHFVQDAGVSWRGCGTELPTLSASRMHDDAGSPEHDQPLGCRSVYPARFSICGVTTTSRTAMPSAIHRIVPSRRANATTAITAAFIRLTPYRTAGFSNGEGIRENRSRAGSYFLRV